MRSKKVWRICVLTRPKTQMRRVCPFPVTHTSVHIAVCVSRLTALCILQDGTEEAAEGATPSLQELGCTFSLQVPQWHDLTS